MNIIIGTPCYSGTVSVYYCASMVETIRMGESLGITTYPIYLSHDALIQRARNDLIAIALENSADAMIFVDDDMEFEPINVFKLFNYPEDVVGGTVRKKTDDAELYNINTQNLDIGENGLIKVNSLGTGFLKLSNKAMQSLWDNSPEYENEGKLRKMIFDVKIIDGELVSEDNVMCRRLRELGYSIYLDPEITNVHIGGKRFIGDFSALEKNY